MRYYKTKMLQAKVTNNWTQKVVFSYEGTSQYTIINYFVTRFSNNFTLEVEGIKCKINYYLACLYLHLYRTRVDKRKTTKKENKNENTNTQKD